MTTTLTVKSDLLATLRGLEDDLQKLNGCHASLERLHDEVSRGRQAFERNLKTFLQSFSSGLSMQQQGALRQLQLSMQSMQSTSLALQNQLASENRQFTVISNVMKSRHGAAKNAIDNLR